MCLGLGVLIAHPSIAEVDGEEYSRDKTFKKQGKIQNNPILPRDWGRMRMEKRPLDYQLNSILS